MRPMVFWRGFAAALALGAVVGCSRGAREDAIGTASEEIRSVADLKGRICGVVLGTAMQEIIEEVQPGVEYRSFNDYSSALDALRLGKIDAVPMDDVVVRRWEAARPEIFRIAATFGDNPYGFFFPKGSPLTVRANAVIERMKATGELSRIVTKWCDASDLDTVPPEKTKGGHSGKLHFATSADFEPGAFVRNGEVVGFDIDIIRRIADELGLDLKIDTINMSALVSAVQSGRADVGGGCVTITEARKEKVDFSNCYLNPGFAILTRRGRADGSILSPEDLKGRHVAHLSSDFHKQGLLALQPDIVFDPYTEYAFAVESLRQRKLDALSLGRTYADIWMAKFPGEFAVAFDYADDECAFLLPKGSPLRAALSAEIRRMKAAGETAAIVRKWCDAAKAGEVARLPTFPPPPPNAPTVKVASAAQAEPWCFVFEDGVAGIDIEILVTVASRLGWRLETKIYSWGGMVDAVNGGKTDIANGGIYIGGRTFPTVDATEPYADEKMCLLVRNADWRPPHANGFVTVLCSLRDSFVRTFVTENRWRMMTGGLCTTLVLTFLSALFGTLLAFPLWLMRISRCRPIAAFAKGYISLLQGTPVLVLLMVLFYLVFGKVDIEGLWVAVIGFSLNGSAYFGEALRSGVSSVPRGQTEAALALGYGPWRAFFRFVLPQAVRTVLPVYRGELINLLKSTSIVGYIAINDLTKASDLVRSRTYESFFPIITTAAIYFVAAWLLALALERFGRRLDPASHRTQAMKEGNA